MTASHEACIFSSVMEWDHISRRNVRRLIGLFGYESLNGAGGPVDGGAMDAAVEISEHETCPTYSTHSVDRYESKRRIACL